ncbi:MAG: sugar phosphate isomerase/epimerase [Ktedonobacterales bacterium]
MQISFSTGTFYHRPLSYSLKLARDLGYDGVEVVLGTGYLLLGAGPLRRALVRTGVRALSVHPPFYPFPGWSRDPQISLPRAVGVARTLGAEVCVAHTIYVSGADSPRGQYFGAALEAGVATGEGAVALAVESNQYNRRRRRYYLDDLRRLTEYAQEHVCAITFDTCHAGANGEDLLEDYAIVRPALRNIHLSDTQWGEDGVVHTHVTPGRGSLALKELLTTLAQDHYDGLITLELHPREVGGLWDDACARSTFGEALAFVRAATTTAPATPSLSAATGA